MYRTGAGLQSVSHFELLGQLGAGGMGVVYKARDVRLNRIVALKILPPEESALADRRRRFLREAQSASALNHPNIVTIYEVATEGDTDYIAMEFVPGKNLQQIIRRKGLRVKDALRYAVQIADALSVAHAAGIIHRDLKPANVMVTQGGTAKLLDFGLAKLSEPAGWTDLTQTEPLRVFRGAAPAPDLAYQELLRTEAGMLVGTVAYMSPEQAEGRKTDARSDIFSFGAVLYEMLTGVRPFHRDTKEATLTAILREEPAPPSRFAGLSPELERVLMRCLRKDPERRWQQMADVKIALEEVKEEFESGLTSEVALRPGASRSPLRRLVWVAAILVLLSAGTLAWLFFPWTKDAETPPVTVPLATYPGVQDAATFSPDGNQIAFLWNGSNQDNVDIYAKMIGFGALLRLTTNPASDISPSWSADGRFIAFGRVLSKGRYAVMVVPAIGGAERQLTEAYLPTQVIPGPYIAWSPDGSSLAIVDKAAPAQAFSIFLLSVETAEKRRLTFPDARIDGDTTPSFSPDGRTLAFSRRIFGAASEDLYLLPLTPGLRPDGEPRRLTSGFSTAGTPVWTPDGREIVFSSDKGGRSNLWRITAKRAGTPRRLAFTEDAASPAISRDRHRLAYTRAIADVNLWRLELPGSRGKPADHPVNLMSNSTRVDFNPQYSPDGTKIAFASDRTGRYEIWVSDADGSNAMAVTSMGAHMTGTPRWSSDGQWIAFDSNLTGDYEIYVVSPAGGNPRRLQTEPGHNAVPSWSHDGHWIYFSSNRTGSYQEWKIPSAGGKAVQVTKNGAYTAFESPDGNFLYYTRSDGVTSLWKVPVNGGDESQVLDSLAFRAFAVTKDGIYYLSPASPGAGVFGFFGFAATQPRPSPTRPGAPAAWLKFFNFATGKSAPVAPIGKPLTNGLTVSADGRWILYSQIDQYVSDLMLVENFR